MVTTTTTRFGTSPKPRWSVELVYIIGWTAVDLHHLRRYHGRQPRNGNAFWRRAEQQEISVDELHEFVIHFAAYAGHPRATAARAALDVAWARLGEN